MPGLVRIYVDESVPVAIAHGLKRRGVDAWAAKDSGNLGLTDEEQFDYAVREQAAVFTHDDDFLKLAAGGQHEHFGVIYAHQQDLPIGECIRRLKVFVETHDREECRGCIFFL